MDDSRFWEIIEAADHEFGSDMDRKSQALKEAIAQLSSSEAMRFSEIFDEKMDHAYTHALWGAAYLIQMRNNGDRRSQ